MYLSQAWLSPVEQLTEIVAQKNDERCEGEINGCSERGFGTTVALGIFCEHTKKVEYGRMG